MLKCNDYWCEHYDKNRGNCDKCLKNEAAAPVPDLNIILKNRAVKQMALEKETGAKGKNR